MASKTVKGLTVKINGDTTSLGKALQAVEKQSRSLSSELTDVQRLLKYDSTSVVALTQKKELLTKAVKACADKLEILRDAEKQVQAQFDKGEASREQVYALQREIEATEIKMKDYQKSLDGAYKSLNTLGVETEDVKEATQRMSAEAEAAKTTQQKLTEHLNEVNKEYTEQSGELKKINTLLKNNSDDTELLAQKKAVLGEAMQSCSEKIRTLEQKEYDLIASGQATEAQIRDIRREAIEAEQAFLGYKDELAETDRQLTKLALGLVDLEPELDENEQAIERNEDRVKRLDTRYESLTKQLKDVDRGLKDTADNADLLARKKELLAKAVETAKDRLEALEQAQADVERRMRQGEDLTDAYEELKTDVARAKAELSQLDDELRRVNGRASGMDELGDETKEAGEAAERAVGGYTVFKDILADICSEVLQEFVELMKEATKYILLTGMDFEQSMSKVEALLGPTEATGEAMAELTQLALDMGAKTKFSAGESAEAMTFLAQAGWDAEQIMSGLPGVMALAATDGVELATAAEICANALNSLGYEAADATEFADVLAVVAAASCTNVEEMGYAFQYVGPVAGALGYDIDDLAVALGVMADAGIKGEKAGTSLRSLFTNLAKPTAAMSTAMEQYGISLTDAHGNMLPFGDVMAQLRGVFAGLTEEQQASLAATLAGKTGMAGLLSIVNAAPEDFYGMMEAIDEADGAADRMATTMQDNLAGDVEKLGGAFETLSIKIFNGFSEPLRDATQALTGFLEGTVSLPELLETIGGAISEMAAGFAEFLPTLTEMGDQLVHFLIDGITNGLPKVIDGLLGLVQSIGSYLTEMAPTFLQFGVDLIMNLAQGITDFIPQLINIAGDIIGSLSGGIQQGTADFISNALTLLDGFADKLAEAIPVLIEKGAEFLLNMAKGISQALPEFIARAPEIISKFANLINDNFPTILAKGIGIIWELIKGIIKAIPDFIANIPKIIKAFVDVWEAFNWLSLGKKAIDLLGKGIKAMGGWLKNAGKWVLDTIVNIIKNLPQTLLNLGKNAISFLGNGIKGCGSIISNAAKFIWDTIVNFLLDLPSKLLSIGEDLVRGLWSGVKNMMSWLWDKVSNFGGTIIGWFTDLFDINSPSKVFAWMGEMLDRGLAKGILDNIDDPLDAASKMASGVLGTMDGFDGMSVERSIKNGEMRRVMEVTAMSDSTMLGKLDKIVSAIERGQVLTIDGKALVGGTVASYDNALGQRRMLAARGAV